MCLDDFVSNPANLLFQAIKSSLCPRARIHTHLDENEPQTEFEDRNDTLSEFWDQNDTPLHVRGPAMNFTL